MTDTSTLTLLLDNITTAVIGVDKDLNIFFVNNETESLLGISRSNMLQHYIGDFFYEVDDGIISFIEAIKSNQSFTKRKATWRAQGNNEIIVDYSITPIHAMDKIIIEVRQLNRLMKISREEALISTHEMSRNLVRSLAHEIKNPLGGIRGSAQLLERELEKKLPNISLQEYTQIIIHEADRLRDLVDKMLGPRVPLVLADINIHEILEHISSIINADAKGSISITKDYDPSIPKLKGDKNLLIQAFLNVTKNAMQAVKEKKNSTEEKRLNITTRVQRRFTIGKQYYPLLARISIQDNGDGIPEEIINDIFFPMITGRANGTGLGLAITQDIFNQHKGLIECESRNGLTTFTFYLPINSSDDSNE